MKSKSFKIIIAFTIINVFLLVVGLLVLSGWWLSTFWADSYERPIGQIYVTSKDNTYETTFAQIVFYKNDDALTSLLTRDVSQKPNDRDFIVDIPFEAETLSIDFYTLTLNEDLRATGFTQMFKLRKVKNSNNKLAYDRADEFLEVMYSNKPTFRYFITDIVPVTLTIDHSSNNAKYDIIASPEGLSLKKVE